MASHDAHSSASSFTLRVTRPAARWLVTRIVREAVTVHGRWLRMTLNRVLPRLHFGLLGLRPGGRLILLASDSAYIVEQYSGSDAHIERIGSHRHVDANPLGTKLDALLGQSVSLVSK